MGLLGDIFTDRLLLDTHVASELGFPYPASSRTDEAHSAAGVIIIWIQLYCSAGFTLSSGRVRYFRASHTSTVSQARKRMPYTPLWSVHPVQYKTIEWQ